MSTPLTEMERAKKIGGDFIRMYYKVMRSFSSHLHLFYEDDSSVVVYETQEAEPSVSIQANNPQNVRSLLQWMYTETDVTLFTCVPQPSMNDSIILVVSGKLKRKLYETPRDFTQVLVLKRQTSGYYIKTDTMHIMSDLSSMELDSTTIPNQKPMTSDLATGSTPSIPVVKRHQPNDSCMDCTLMSGSFEENNNMTSVLPVTFKNEEGNKVEKEYQTSGKDSDCKSIMDPAAFVPTQSTPTTVLHSSSCASSENNAVSKLFSEGMLTPVEKEIQSAPGSAQSHRDSPYLHSSNSELALGNNHRQEAFKQPELKSMFAARLPLGTTPTVVHQLFSQYGTLNKDNAVKVFTGLTHCYACITFTSESEMRKALNSDIRLDGMEIVKEIWAPRGRIVRRTGRAITHKPDSYTSVYRAR
eukprot:g978.t1